MAQIQDIYYALGIDSDTKPFDQYFCRGVLRIRDLDKLNDLTYPKTPYYILELSVDSNHDPIVAVFKAKAEVDEHGKPVRDEKGNWVAHKAYDIKSKDYSGLSSITEDTELSRMARQYRKARTPKKDLEPHAVKKLSKPLYISEVEMGMDTLSGAYGLGFKEYTTENVNGKLQQGKPTGVFICLEDVEWSEPRIKTKDMYDYAQAKRQKDNYDTDNLIRMKW